jgi:tungstate transport system substrate-binding protein
MFFQTYYRRKRMNALRLLLLLAAVSLPYNAMAAEKMLMMATTTSTDDSGLLDFLKPTFEKETGITLKWVAVGTGKALEIAKNCDADVLLVHAPAAEKKFVADGHGIDRREIMYNDFVLVGPKADPAGIKGMATAAALKQLAAKKAPFVSRGDKSGTHKAEQKLWEVAGMAEPSKEAWYASAGQGMMATIAMAAEKNGYTLTDRGTWIKYAAKQADKNPLAIVVEGDKALFNQYSVITVNPAQCPKVDSKLAAQFEDWRVKAETQKLIASYTLEKKQLFFPNAAKK